MDSITSTRKYQKLSATTNVELSVSDLVWFNMLGEHGSFVSGFRLRGKAVRIFIILSCGESHVMPLLLILRTLCIALLQTRSVLNKQSEISSEYCVAFYPEDQTVFLRQFTALKPEQN